jgi:hypothetical protein
VVGSAQFASNGTHIDITYATGHVSKFLQASKAPHVNAAKHLLKYLKGHLNVSITYTSGGPTPNQHVGYYDTDFASDMDDRKSRSGYMLMLNNGPVLWDSQKQGCTAMSTTESEYIVACTATKQIVWMRRLLHELGCVQQQPTTLSSNKQAAIRLVRNPEFHKQTKHIDQ